MPFTLITGDRLRYGHGLVRMYRLQRMIDKDDLPTGEWIGDKTNGAVPLSAPQEHSTVA